MSDGMTDNRSQYSEKERLNIILGRINDRQFSQKNRDELFLALASFVSDKNEFSDLTVSQVKMLAAASASVISNLMGELKRVD